jgi:hypothetical protein
MRTVVVAIAALAVTAAVVVGFMQTRNSDRATNAAPEPLTLAQVSRPVAGAPPVLAALRRRVNALERGGAKALDAQLRARCAATPSS